MLRQAKTMFLWYNFFFQKKKKKGKKRRRETPSNDYTLRETGSRLLFKTWSAMGCHFVWSILLEGTQITKYKTIWYYFFQELQRFLPKIITHNHPVTFYSHLTYGFCIVLKRAALPTLRGITLKTKTVRIFQMSLILPRSARWKAQRQERSIMGHFESQKTATL